MTKIFGRKKEIKILDRVFQSDSPEFVVVYGRRRIGKTWLIREYFQEKDCILFKTTGSITESKMKPQLYNFIQDIKNTFDLPEGVSISSFDTWESAFELLASRLKEIGNKTKIVLFFDEIPWFDTPKSRFVSAFGHFWNHYVDSSLNSHIKVVVCGSATSWISRNIINEKGSLHQRATTVINLQPFDLNETKGYLKYKNIDLSDKSVFNIYCAIGGVAEYLNKIPKGKSTSEIIDELFFIKDAILRKEFNAVFSATFQNHKIHLKICELLAKSPYGLTRQNLIKQSEGLLASTKELSLALEELTESSFIKKTGSFTLWKKAVGAHDAKYKIIDEYSLFYFKWIYNKNISFDDNLTNSYWSYKMNTNEYHNWVGHAFEGVCHKNIDKIRDSLKINGIVSSYWWHCVAEDNFKGAEIDLLLQRIGKDDSINICELKFYGGEYVLTKNHYENIKNKIFAFREKTKFKGNIFVTLITSEGAVSNSYYKEIIDNQVVLLDLIG